MQSNDLKSRVIRSRSERLAGYRRVLEARSLGATEQRLRELARDDIRPVRLWAARNDRCPPDGLMNLAKDQDSIVRWNALMNASMPGAGLQLLSELEAKECSNSAEPRFTVRSKVLAHPNVDGLLADHLRDLGVRPEPVDCDCVIRGHPGHWCPW